MKLNRDAAYKLRIAGHSYNEITAKLGIPKSTLNGWFRGLILSDTAQTRLRARMSQGTLNAFIKRNKLQTHAAEQRAQATRKEAAQLVQPIQDDVLRVIGAALYWAEGYKRLKVRDGKERMGHTISFVNADEVMIRTFLKFLKNILEIPDEKVHLYMRLYKSINESVALHHWMHVTQLPKKNFHKTTYLVSIASQRKRPYNRLPYGTLQVEIRDTKKFHYLMGLIEGVKNQF